jgi:hypothetical protein
MSQDSGKYKNSKQLRPEDIKRFLDGAEKSGFTREEVLESIPPFLRKKILELNK